MLNSPASQFTLKPETLLSIGLGITFLYAGIASLLDPTSWIGYLPAWTDVFAPADTLIVVHGIVQTLLGITLIVGIATRPVALIVALDIAGILAFYGIDAVSFRDIGLFFAALALLSLSLKSNLPQEGAQG